MGPVEDYFNQIGNLPTTKQTGDAYEKFALIFLKYRPEIRDGWLLEDVPLSILTFLDLSRTDRQGVDGVLLTIDGFYLPFQAKFRRDGASLRAEDVSNSIVTFYRRLERRIPMAEPIIITNCKRVSTNTDISSIPWLNWIFRNEQVGLLGLRCLVQLGIQTPIPQLTLRDPQVGDLIRLNFNYVMLRDQDRYQRALFYAVMGYGKSICIAEYCRIVHQYSLGLIVIVAPTLKLVNQLYRTLRDRYSSGSYNPVIFVAASDLPSDYPGRTTGRNLSVPDRQSLSSDSPRTFRIIPNCPQIILTTYVSYPKVRNTTNPHMVLFDEVHNYKLPLDDPVHYVGFTATPTPETYSKLEKIVERKLGWAIEAGYLVDYRINAFVWTGQDQDQPGSRVFLYRDMILKILSMTSTRMLVTCSNGKEAGELASELRKAGVVSFSIVSKEDREKDRTRKEQEIQRSNSGVLTSVRIYREGVDLPWLDSIFIGVGTMTEVTAGQILGRPLRKYPGKEMAEIYFPVLTGERYTEVENVAYKPLLDFMEKISIMDPDVFQGSTEARKKYTKLRVLFSGSKPRSTLEQPEELQIQSLVDSLAVQVYNKRNNLITSGFSPTWKNCVIAAILRKCPGDEFRGSDIKNLGRQLSNFREGRNSGGPPTPDQTVSRVLTVDLINENLIQRVSMGVYRIVDRRRMEQIIGTIPQNFPV